MQRSFARLSGISLLLLLVQVLGPVIHGQTAPVRDRIVQPVDESALTTLGGNVHPLATSQNDLGAAPVSEAMSRVRLVLRRSAAQEAALEGYLAAVQNKNSPSYHKWLTPAQFGKLYGPSDNDVQKLTGWLQGHGFNVDEVSSGRTHIAFSGSVAQVQDAFHIAIHSYRANGVDFLANTSDPKIPSAFAAVVSGVAHLNTVPLKPMYVHGFGAKYDPSTRRIVPLSTSGRLRPDLTEQDTSGNNYLVAVPADVATIYDTPNSKFNANFSGSATYDGTGAIIGVAGQSAIQTSIIANYRSLFIGDSKIPTIFNPNNVGDVSGDDTESYLDNEVAGSMAPGASIYFYTEPSSAGGVFQAADDAISANQVDILSISYGDCESDQGNADNQIINAEWQQAAAQGITVLVSTGDTGSAGCDVSTDPNGNNYTAASGGLAVNGLGSTPYNIAVGGTDYDVLANNFGTYVSTPSNGGSASSLYRTAKSYIPEATWNDSTIGNGTVSQNVPLTSNALYASSANIAAGAGGKSSCVVQTGAGAVGGGGYVSPSSCTSGYAKPSWQTGAGVPNDGVRDLPDVSLLSGDGSYGALWAVCDNSSDGNGGTLDCAVTSGSSGFENDAVGGTSASTPAFASILALVRQKTGNRLGQAAQTLYSLFNGSSSAAIFHDVTSGNNSVPCAQSTVNAASCVSNTAGYSYETGYDTNTGYDLATGLGSVDVTALVNGWAAASSPATPIVTVTPSASSITITEPLVVAITVAGPTSGSAVPTGSVVLTAGSYTSDPTTLASGAASITVPAGTLSEGTYAVQVSYTPDTASSGVYFSGSSSVSITVGGTFAVAPAASALTVAAGATSGNTTTLTVNTTNAFAGTVNLTCALTTSPSGANASYSPACLIAPTSVTLSGTTSSATATATFKSTARSTSTALASPQERHNHWYTAVGGATLAFALFFGIPARRRSWRSMLALLVFLVGMAGVGCGGGGGGNSTPVATGTTAGQYVFTVTGTDAATATTTATTMVTLTVN
jgi:subtilase family serine protease